MQQKLFDDLKYLFLQIHIKEENIITLKNLLHTTKNDSFDIYINGQYSNLNKIIPYNFRTEIQVLISDSIQLLENELKFLKCQL